MRAFAFSSIAILAPSECNEVMNKSLRTAVLSSECLTVILKTEFTCTSVHNSLLVHEEKF